MWLQLWFPFSPQAYSPSPAPSTHPSPPLPSPCRLPSQAKRRLKKSVLALLVAVVSSPRAGAEDTAGALAGTSLPEVLWREFLDEGDGLLRRGDSGERTHPTTARRARRWYAKIVPNLDVTRPPGSGCHATAGVAIIHQPPPLFPPAPAPNTSIIQVSCR